MTQKEIRKEIKDIVAGLPNCDYGKIHIMTIGRKWVTVLSLYEGSKPEKISLEAALTWLQGKADYNEEVR